MKPPPKERATGKSPLSESKRQPSHRDRKANKSKTLSILVPVDIAAPSRASLEFAGDFARRYNGRVLLLSVIEDEPSRRSPAHPLVVTRQAFRARVHFKLSDLGIRHVGADRISKILIHSGVPFEQIIEAARALKPNLIIMATHGYTGLKHMLLGSTAERVIRSAPCPVLTVRETGKDAYLYEPGALGRGQMTMMLSSSSGPSRKSCHYAHHPPDYRGDESVATGREPVQAVPSDGG
jgi:nucleotide-binding universal stress UspA family protein